MYINNIDNLFDGIINNFYIYLENKKFFEKISSDNNFVKFLNEITDTIKNYIKDINIKEIETIVAKKSQVNYIVEIIKRYCAFYIYLGIAYYYKGDRGLFITNIIETSKNMKDNTFSISNFYNSENNAKIILMYGIIKDILELKEYKIIERIKILLENEPIKYQNTIILLNDIGEDYFTEYILTNDNFHNILKTFIFRQIYLTEEKNDIIKIITDVEIDEAEYKFIDIVISKQNKLIDFTFLQSILSLEKYGSKNKAEEYYSFLEQYRDDTELHLLNNNKMIQFLFNNRILIPITEDYLRYHKNTEKYDKDINSELKDRDTTKIKYIINKVNKVMNLYSSIYEKNQKIKLEAMNLFYKTLEYMDAILYNDNEEVKIINKLEMSELSTDIDYIIDLNNIRNYPYLNFKDMSKDGIKLRPNTMIQGIRYSNIKHQNPKNRKLDLRIGNLNIPMNIVGVIYNPSHRYLECINTSELIDIRKKNTNGFDALIDMMRYSNDMIRGLPGNKKDRSLYYWLFDTKLDKVKLDKYKNFNMNDSKIYIENILGEVYNHFITLQKEIIINNINNSIKKNNNIWELTKLHRNYISSYRYTEHMPPNFLNQNVLDKFMIKIMNKKQNIKSIDKKCDIIKLPFSSVIKKKDNIIRLGKEIDMIDLSILSIQPICHHYIKWMELGKVSRKNDTELNQLIFDFVKQYVKTNARNEYVCKSCSELLDLKKYVYEGTYVAELDTFLTTNLATNLHLHEIPKYAKYSRTIRNIEKNIEKICYATNLSYYIGNTPVIKLRRKIIIKDVIDIILIHAEYLKNQPKDRIQKAVEKYNIHPNLTNLFFFELKDDVFLTNSLDTDYYKTLKFNNVMAYILLMLIADLNIGMIVGMRDDKKCNYFLYSNIGEGIFSQLYIRMNEKEKIAVSKIPLLAYVLFYMSCIFTNNNIWLWNDMDKKQQQQYNIQKIIIHTMVDLINTLIEANMLKDKNFLYELIVNRIQYKIKNIYTDENALNQINNMMKQKIRIDTTTNKISYIVKKEKLISIDTNIITYNPIIVKTNKCESMTGELDKNEFIKFNYDINAYTNCIDGNFHEWEYKDNKLVCNLCSLMYNDILSKDLKSNDIENISRIKQLKLLYLRKMANTFCISGETHDIDITTNICNKCKLNVTTYKYSESELFKLEKNIRNLNNIKSIAQLDKIKRHFEKELKKKEMNNITLSKFNERYIKYTNNKLINYIDDFIDTLIKSVGIKIKIDSKTIYLRDTMYIIRNDYIGNDIKDPIIILSSENKIQEVLMHPFFKINVIFYRDNLNNIYVYYDNITKNYIGYSKDNKTFIKYKSNASIEIISSIKNMIVNMGLENQLYNMHHVSSNNNNIVNTITQIIRTRCNNLRQCIERTASIIEKVSNNYSSKNNLYNINEYKLVNEFQRSLRNFKTNDDNNSHLFSHMYTITNNITINKIDETIVNTIPIIKQYIDTYVLINMNNMDCKLLFYYVYNLNKLINFNNSHIRTNLCYMIIRLIIFNYNIYYVPFENSQIRKFDSFLLTDAPYIDESLRIVGYYMDLVNTKEIDEEVVKEVNYDMNEEMNAIDMDDNEKEDADLDYDANDEMLEHFTDG